MSDRFRYRKTRAGVGSEPWFRVGSVDGSTVNVVIALSVLSMVIWAASPSALRGLVLIPGEVRAGQIWRLATWPFANAPDIWTALTLFFMYQFGGAIEELLGRYRMLALMGSMAVVPALFATFLERAAGGIQSIAFGLLIAFAIEFPGARFLFNLSVRLVVAVLLGIQVLTLLGSRATTELVLLVLGVAVVIVMLRSLGLGADLPSWVPRLPLPSVAGRKRAPAAPKPRGSTAPPKRRRPSNLTVVQGGATGSAPEPPVASREPTPTEVDAVLDKISASGIGSLTPEERQILEAHSRRRRS
jgi:membrane associated rhomboid family serine protease